MWEGDAAVEPDGDVEGGVAVEHDAPEGRVLDLLEDGPVVGAEGEDGRAHLVARNINYLLINHNYLIIYLVGGHEDPLPVAVGRRR